MKLFIASQEYPSVRTSLLHPTKGPWVIKLLYAFPSQKNNGEQTKLNEHSVLAKYPMYESGLIRNTILVDKKRSLKNFICVQTIPQSTVHFKIVLIRNNNILKQLNPSPTS